MEKEEGSKIYVQTKAKTKEAEDLLKNRSMKYKTKRLIKACLWCIVLGSMIIGTLIGLNEQGDKFLNAFLTVEVLMTSIIIVLIPIVIIIMTEKGIMHKISNADFFNSSGALVLGVVGLIAIFAFLQSWISFFSWIGIGYFSWRIGYVFRTIKLQKLKEIK